MPKYWNASKPLKTICLDGKHQSGDGQTGTYYRISRTRGVKVYEYTHAELKRDLSYENIIIDFNIMRDMECEYIPKAYAVVSVKRNGYWYAGILMEHIDGRTLAAIHGYDADAKANAVQERLYERIQELTEHTHTDLHRRNIIFCKKTRRYRAIDIEENYIDLP